MDYKTRKMITERLLTCQEAAAYTGLSESTLQERYYRGALDGVLKGRTLLFDRKDLASMVRQPRPARHLPLPTMLKP